MYHMLSYLATANSCRANHLHLIFLSYLMLSYLILSYVHSCRIELLGDWKRYHTEGLNSVKTFPVKILATTKHSLYTNITVDIGSKPQLANVEYVRSNWAWFTDWLFLWKLNI